MCAGPSAAPSFHSLPSAQATGLLKLEICKTAFIGQKMLY
jgi:hypothetical protein